MYNEICTQFGLLPRPAELKVTEGECLPGVGQRSLRGGKESLAVVSATWTDLPRQEVAGAPLTLFVGPEQGTQPPAADLEAPAQPESYALRLEPHGATLVGRDAAGLFYGLQTLRQLLEGAPGAPCLEIHDWPRHAWRGFQIDLGRQPEGMDTLKRYIDLMATCKLNQCYLYVENAFAYAACPEACSPDALTPEQVRELDAYCQERYMQLIPAANFLGHSDWLLDHPKYQHLSETREGPAFRKHMSSNSVICTSLPEAWELIEAMIDNLCAAFSAPVVHVSMDETWPMGSCSLCAPVREQQGEGELFRRHAAKLHELLAARGRRMMIWGDMPAHWPEIIPQLPKDILVVDWYYEPIVDYVPIAYFNWSKFNTTGAWRAAGFEVLMAPWDRELPIYTAARAARLWDCSGLFLTKWEQSQQMLWELFVPTAYGADCAWAPVLETPAEALPRLAQALFGTQAMEAVALMHATMDCQRAVSGEGQGAGRFLRYRRQINEYELAPKWAFARQAIEACRKLPAFQKPENARRLAYIALRVARWDAGCRADWLVNEAGLTARALLAGRDRGEAQADLARFAAELAQVAAVQQAALAEMTRQWEADRRGITPVQNVMDRMRAEAESTAAWAEQLAAFAAAPAAGKGPFDHLRLVVEAGMPEANAQRFIAEVSADGQSWTEVPLGGFRRMLGCDSFPQALDMSIACDVPADTKYVRLSSPGVAGIGLRTVRLIDAASERLPHAVVETGGQVWFAEHLLADDARLCLMNEAEVAQSFYHPETLETSWITLEF
ncbi:MAG TPA: family 20 glycosylhydrolase [Armatimonadota bacterium]|jgi:hypothetical protein